MSGSMQNSMYLGRINQGPTSCTTQDSMVLGRVDKRLTPCATQGSNVLETPVKGPISRAIHSVMTPPSCVQEKKIISIPVSEGRFIGTLHTRSKYTLAFSDPACVANTTENSVTSSVSQGRPAFSDGLNATKTTQSSSTCDIIQSEPDEALEDKSKPQTPKPVLPASGTSATVVASTSQSNTPDGLPISSSAANSCIYDAGATLVSTSEWQDDECNPSITAASTTTLPGDGSFPEIKTFPKKSGSTKYKNVSINTNGVVQKLLVPVNDEYVRDESFSICNNSMDMFRQTFAYDQVCRTGRGGEGTPYTVRHGTLLQASPSSIPGTLNPQLTGTLGKTLAATSIDTITAKCFPVILHQNNTPEYPIGNPPVLTTALPRFPISVNRDENAHNSFCIPGATFQANAENEILEQPPYARAPVQHTWFTPDCLCFPMAFYGVSGGLPEALPGGSTDAFSRMRMQPEFQYQTIDQTNLLCVNKGSHSLNAETTGSGGNLYTGVQRSPSSMCQTCFLNHYRVTENDALSTCNTSRPKKKRQVRKQSNGKRSNPIAKKRKLDGKKVSDGNAKMSESSQKEGDSLQQSSTSQNCSHDGNSELADVLKTNTSLGKPFSRYFFVKTNTGCFLIPRSDNQANEKSHQTKTVYKIVMYNTGKAVVIRRDTGVKQYFVEPVDDVKAYSLIKGIVERGIVQAPKINYATPREP